MDGGASGGAVVTGGGPAPFILKTYEMVDDSTTDAIVSWSGSGKSFVVWDPPEFQRVLLPSYFKHKNFSSFIRQLNTYRFRKIDPERWEFANEEFIKDQKHLLKNIHRRKPVHSHSQPQGSVDPERAAFEEEIDKLTCEKTELERNLLGYKQQQSAAKGQLENLTDRIGSMEQRQKILLSVLEKAVQNPEFVERLAQKLESMDFSAYNKKRRLPELENSQSVQENVPVENQSVSRTESGNVFQQDFGNNLRLQLSPALSDMNLPSHSTQSSNEDRISPQGRNEGWSNDVQVRTGSFLSPSDTLELSDTGASFTLNINSSVSLKTGPESQKIQTLASNDDRDGHISCILDLTLASSSLELEKSRGIQTDQRPNTNSDVRSKKQVAATGQNRVNDVFWEQFLTERPGCSDNEEATSSGFRKNHYNQQEERRSTKGISKNTKGLEQLTL